MASNLDGIVAVGVLDAPLIAAEIPPEDVVEGTPAATSFQLRAADDGVVRSGVWHCTPGKFFLPHVHEETVTIVRGRATVTPEGGSPIELHAGDTAFFPAGRRVLWEVHEKLCKSWHFYVPADSAATDSGPEA